jgi:hypothetical protein
MLGCVFRGAKIGEKAQKALGESERGKEKGSRAMLLSLKQLEYFLKRSSFCRSGTNDLVLAKAQETQRRWKSLRLTVFARKQKRPTLLPVFLLIENLRIIS